MATNREKKEMSEYLTIKLEGSNLNIIPRTREIVPGIESNYIRIGANGLVFLVDQTYPNYALERVHEKAITQGLDIAFVFFKDGKTFFRSASKDKRHKKDQGRSLKQYLNPELNRMIMFRPEEEFVSLLNEGGMQYYQQESERLEQGIVAYNFEPIVFDYSHKPLEERKYTGIEQNSRKLRIWTKRDFWDGKLKLEKGILVPQ